MRADRAVVTDQAAASRAFALANAERVRAQLQELGAASDVSAKPGQPPAPTGPLVADANGVLWRITVDTKGVLGAVKA